MIGFIAGAGLDAAVIDAGAVRFRPMMLTAAAVVVGSSVILLTLALGYWVSPYWYLFTAFVGLNLFQSAFTNWCPMMTILRKLGVPGN
jgi:hypothetical protein